jgi:predicted nucleic acid-binding protein
MRQDLSFSTLTQNILPDESLLTICRIFALDASETEALALMQHNPQAMLLTDDASARLAANQMGFRVHGTIGILIRSIRRGHRKPEETVRILYPDKRGILLESLAK